MSEFPSADAILARLRTQKNLTAIGEAAIAVIKARTLRGVFLEGSSPGAERYSSTPMPLPMGALTKQTQARVNWLYLKEREVIRVWTNMKSRITWVLLEGGYKRLRELAGKESDRVTLNWSGHMMRALTIAGVNEKEGTVKVSFSDYRAAQIAGYHYAGVGRGRKKRIFLGLTKAEEDQIASDALKGVKMQF